MKARRLQFPSSTAHLSSQRRPSPTVSAVPVDPALARELRNITQSYERSRARRDMLIREASEAGASLREIASLVRLTHVGVKKIIDKDPDPNDYVSGRDLARDEERRKRAGQARRVRHAAGGAPRAAPREAVGRAVGDPPPPPRRAPLDTRYLDVV